MSDVDIVIPDGLPELGWTGFGALGVLWTLGPSVKALGQNLGKWTDYHTSNLLRLSEKVERRLASAPADQQDGEVHPRVAKEVVDTAAWISDDLHQEYLASMLVGARSPGGTDDIAMYDVRLLKALPAVAVRLHFAIYNSYRGTNEDFPAPAGRTFHDEANADRITLSAPVDAFAAVCGGLAGLARANDVLYRERLVRDMGPIGKTEYQYIPSGFGASVFTRAFFGKVNSDVALLSLEKSASLGVPFTPPPNPPTVEGSVVGPVRPRNSPGV